MANKVDGSGYLGPNNNIFADASGNVGIGTATTTENLTIKGSYPNFGVYRNTNVVASGDAASAINLGALNVSTQTAGAQIWGVLQQNTTSGYMSFNTLNASTLIERVRIDDLGNFRYNAGYGSVANTYGCRAWVKFGGGTTYTAGAIQASGGVTSVTAVSAGVYTVNLSFTMPDANFSAVCTTGWTSSSFATDNYPLIIGYSTTTVGVESKWSGAALASNFMNVAVFR
jgi:hypothetical protein